MGRAGGPEHSAAIKRGLTRAKERFEERARSPHRCRHCDGPVVESYTGRRREYCSNTCRQAAYRDREWSLKEYLKEHPHRCWRCNGDVTQPRTGRWREYCSDACRQADYRDRKRSS